MEYSEASQGRMFVIRLHDGEIVHEAIERFAADMEIKEATVTAIGGIGPGSKLTVGPKVPVTFPVEPLHHVLDAPHEMVGNGTIFPNSKDEPILHMHCSCGREGNAVTGCVRSGVIVWLVMEVIISEISSGTRRVVDEMSGFELMVPGAGGKR